MCGETQAEYLWRIGSAKDAGIYTGSWQDVANIMNKAFRESDTEYRTESSYRKKWAVVKEFVEAGIFSKANEDSDLKNRQRELEQLKIFYQDERREWQTQNRESVRLKETLNILGEKMTQIGRSEFPDTAVKHVREVGGNDIVVLLSDFHIGENFSNFYGQYDSEIAKNRLIQLAAEVERIQRYNNSENCYVFFLGDMLSGAFRPSIRVTNKENVIEQIKIATNLIANFCYEMSSLFNSVKFASVAGNHSRLFLNKDETIQDERLDDIVSWAVGLSLSAVSNFKMLDANIDNSLAVTNIRGRSFALVHGDNDSFSKDGALKIMNVLGFKPYAICCGHKHVPAFQDMDGIKMVQSGSLCGSGDNFCRQKRLKSAPSQMVMLVDDEGIKSLHPVELN